MGLRERLEMLGVHFTIQSQPNKGVEAVIIAPRKMNHHE
jgi:signal transduction histidine kinase